jgi:hypothetical protein
MPDVRRRGHDGGITVFYQIGIDKGAVSKIYIGQCTPVTVVPGDIVLQPYLLAPIREQR